MPDIPRENGGAAENVILVINPGSDAPGWKLVPDGPGHVRIERVPGWDPGAIQELSAALTIIAEATQVGQHRDIQHEIVGSATRIVQDVLPNLVQGMGDVADPPRPVPWIVVVPAARPG